VKLSVVAVLLLAAQQARSLTNRRLVLSGTAGPALLLRPLMLAVGVELGLAFAILASTAFLVGKVPPLR